MEWGLKDEMDCAERVKKQDYIMRKKFVNWQRTVSLGVMLRQQTAKQPWSQFDVAVSKNKVILPLCKSTT